MYFVFFFKHTFLSSVFHHFFLLFFLTQDVKGKGNAWPNLNLSESFWWEYLKRQRWDMRKNKKNVCTSRWRIEKSMCMARVCIHAVIKWKCTDRQFSKKLSSLDYVWKTCRYISSKYIYIYIYKYNR